MEYFLGDLSRNGLHVWRMESGQWCWEWQGQMGYAEELGGAIADALYWYFGLAPEPSRNVTRQP